MSHTTRALPRALTWTIGILGILCIVVGAVLTISGDGVSRMSPEEVAAQAAAEDQATAQNQQALDKSGLYATTTTSAVEDLTDDPTAELLPGYPSVAASSPSTSEATTTTVPATTVPPTTEPPAPTTTVYAPVIPDKTAIPFNNLTAALEVPGILKVPYIAVADCLPVRGMIAQAV
jgi:type II secretory pathway pseudopilin PulG